MNLRDVAFAVQEATHPVNWTLDGNVLTSPSVQIERHPAHVDIHIVYKHFIPIVRVSHREQGEFRSYNPFDWPGCLLWLHLGQRELHEETLKRLWRLRMRRRP